MANQFTKYTGTVTGVAGSLITALNAALVTGQGWTTATNGNRSWYRPPSGNQLYLAVDDSGVVTAKEARMTGFEGLPTITASPITGTNPFPTAAQNSTGNGVANVCARKSATADATTRAYQIFADARSMYLFILTGDSAGYYLCFMFGEVFSIMAGDAWNTVVIGRFAENSAVVTNDSLDYINPYISSGAISGNFIARSHTGVAGAVAMCRVGDATKANASTGAVMGTGGLPFPQTTDSGLYLSPVWPTNSLVLRGRMRGFWQICHATTSFADGDTFTGTGALAGKTFQIIKPGGGGGIFCIETSATLETN